MELDGRKYAIQFLGNNEIFYRQLLTPEEIKKEANAK